MNEDRDNINSTLRKVKEPVQNKNAYINFSAKFHEMQ